MAQIHHLSQTAHDRLQAELHDLTTRGRIEVANKIERARELGDLSENGDYHAAKDEQGHMEGRIRHLESILEHCEIVEAADDGRVKPGSVVTVLFDGDDEGDASTYVMASLEERHPEYEIMSPQSPLGQALIDAQAGDTVTYTTPTGATLKVEVVSVELP
jgi:transcription elongation factor GreA